MKFAILTVAALGTAFLPAISHAAEHSVTLGDLQADYVLAPKAGSSAAADISGLATQVSPRDLLGPSKAMKADPQLPAALDGK